MGRKKHINKNNIEFINDLDIVEQLYYAGMTALELSEKWDVELGIVYETVREYGMKREWEDFKEVRKIAITELAGTSLVPEDGEALLIERRGGKAMVIISWNEYKKLKEAGTA